jgi:hypothetical protein
MNKELAMYFAKAFDASGNISRYTTKRGNKKANVYIRTHNKQEVEEWIKILGYGKPCIIYAMHRIEWQGQAEQLKFLKMIFPYIKIKKNIVNERLKELR